jgi:hypothetical protein
MSLARGLLKESTQTGGESKMSPQTKTPFACFFTKLTNGLILLVRSGGWSQN